MDFFGAHHMLDPTRNLEEEGPLLNVNAAECLERLSGLATDSCRRSPDIPSLLVFA